MAKPTIKRICLLLVLAIESLSHLLVLFPTSIQLGQGAIPWLMGNGHVLYSDIFEHRPPLTAWIVALVQPLFRGDTITTVLVLHLITLLLIILAIYAVVESLAPNSMASIIAIVYWVILESIFVNVSFYFEVVQGLFYILAVWALTRTRISDFFIAGLFLGLAFLTKQQTLLALGFIVLWLLWIKAGWRKFLAVMIGFALPTLIVWGLYALAGLWKQYWFWNFTFNIQYGIGSDTPTGDYIRQLLLSHGWLLPFGFVAIQQRKTAAGKLSLLIVLVALAAQAANYPRSGLIHAAAGLPLACVAAGIVLAPLAEKLRGWKTWSTETAISIGLVAVLLVGVMFNLVTSFIPTPLGFRKVIGRDDFVTIVNWMTTATAPTDTLAILPATDSNSQLYPLIKLGPPKTYAPENEFVLAAPFVMSTLQTEWQVTPPTWIIWFPDLIQGPTTKLIQPLVDFMNAHYEMRQTFGPLPFYGKALVMHYKNAIPTALLK